MTVYDHRMDYDIFAHHLVDVAERLYADPSLSYHNWDHIEAATKAYKKLYGEPSSEALVAIAFHDCVYVPGAPSGVNEDLSILQFKRAYREAAKNYSGEMLNAWLVELMIESTKVANHLSSVYMSVIEDDHGFGVAREVGRVLDCDLNGFGQRFDRFVETQSDIIHEYAGELTDTEHKAACVKSAEFLRQFLFKDRIFYTDEAFTLYEQTARTNIRRWCELNGVD